MKIKTITIILLVFLSLFLGCSKKDGNGSTNDSADNKADTSTVNSGQSGTGQIQAGDTNDPRLQRALEKVQESQTPVRRSRTIRPD